MRAHEDNTHRDGEARVQAAVLQVRGWGEVSGDRLAHDALDLIDQALDDRPHSHTAPWNEAKRALATVREALERLRRHPDAWSQEGSICSPSVIGPTSSSHGDRLAHLESLARDPLKLYAMVGLAPNLYASDVLALVEVAKAARETGWKDLNGLCWCEQSQELTGKPHRPQCQRMRDALARLDSGGGAITGNIVERVNRAARVFDRESDGGGAK